MAKKVRFGERLKKGVPPRRSFGVGESGKSGDGKERVATRMKSLSVNTGVILFIVGLSIFACAEVWGADWRLISSTDSYKCFYDAENITRSSKNIVGVWARLEYTEKGISGIVKEFVKHYENLSYSLELWEIDCVKKSSVFYRLPNILWKEVFYTRIQLNVAPRFGNLSLVKLLARAYTTPYANKWERRRNRLIL